jgi:hypothetical protein
MRHGSGGWPIPLIELHLNVNLPCAHRQRARDQQNVVVGGRLDSDQ